jgi:tetratricopeptide (TPR) repeat protein
MQADNLYARYKKGDIKRIVQHMNRDPFHVANQAFLSRIYKRTGEKEYTKFVDYLEQHAKRETLALAFILWGHRSFDKSDKKKMVEYYKRALKLIRDINGPAQKWHFAIWYYWARHEPNHELKEQYVINSILETKFNWSISSSLIETKLFRCIGWLRCFGKSKSARKALDKAVNLAKDIGYANEIKRLFSVSIKRLKRKFIQEAQPHDNQQKVGAP